MARFQVGQIVQSVAPMTFPFRMSITEIRDGYYRTRFGTKGGDAGMWHEDELQEAEAPVAEQTEKA